MTKWHSSICFNAYCREEKNKKIREYIATLCYFVAVILAVLNPKSRARREKKQNEITPKMWEISHCHSLVDCLSPLDTSDKHHVNFKMYIKKNSEKMRLRVHTKIYIWTHIFIEFVDRKTQQKSLDGIFFSPELMVRNVHTPTANKFEKILKCEVTRFF